MQQAPFGVTLSKSDFARHRGVSPAMVTNWKKSGRLVLTLDGQVDVKASDALLDAGNDPSRGGTVGRSTKQRPQEAATAPAGGSATQSFTEVRTEREKFTLKTQELEYRIAAGEVVERSEYNRGLVANVGPTIQRIDTMDARLAARLAAETDVRKCGDMLREESISIRQEVADYAQALIDGAGKKKQ
jgi:hypothetical protein